MAESEEWVAKLVGWVAKLPGKYASNVILRVHTTARAYNLVDWLMVIQRVVLKVHKMGCFIS